MPGYENAYSPTAERKKGPEDYFAAQDADKVADLLISKMEQWRNSLEANGYLEKMRMCWAAYHGAYYTDIGYGHQITFSGAQGELTNMPVNHFRNLAQHMLVMTTSTRPSMDARATNTDYKSLMQTQLANGLLDYYLREKRLEIYLKRAVEYAIVLSAGYIKMEWNATSGEVYDYNEETNTPIYEGDVVFSNLSPFDVLFDPTKEDGKHDWILCRTYKNRFDLMAKFPEHADAIKNMPSKSEHSSFGINRFGYSETDDVSIFELYHKRTECMPNGRYMLFVSKEGILLDSPLPYRSIPVYRIAASDILGTPFGYSPMFDILPLQEGMNLLYSTIMSNQNAFGVQNIYVPRGADLTVNSLAGGLNVIEGNQQAGMPQPLNLTNTPAEVFKFLEMLQAAAETISGVNSVARGNPEASLKSGAALALVQSMALQFMSGLQGEYVQLIEDVGTGLINLLKDFAAVPRIAAIVGKNQRAFLKEFRGDDLSNINRVIVDVGNPLARTTAGRVQMAEHLLQMGLIQNPQDYFAVINTGKLEVLTDNYNSEWALIKGENEKLISGEDVPVLDIDQHKQHIVEHRGILSDPDLRKDGELVQRVLSHIQEHIHSLQTVDPNLLMLLSEQPLGQGAPPPGMSPGGPPPGAGMAPSQPPGPPGHNIPPHRRPPGVAGPTAHTQAGMGPGPGPGQVMQPTGQAATAKPAIGPSMPQPPAPFRGQG